MSAAAAIPDAARAFWTPYLVDGERLVWTGAPEGPPPFGARDMLQLATGLLVAFSGLASFFLTVTEHSPVLPAAQVAVGLFIAFGFRALTRARFASARYALSDRRAMVAQGRRISSWRPGAGFRPELVPGAPGSVLFERQGALRSGLSWAVPPILGFERVADAEQAHRLALALPQKAAA